MAEQGKKVLCIDCDVGLRNLDISLGLTDSGALSFLDVAEGNYSLDRAARHPVYLTLAFLTAPMNTAADEIDPEVFGRMLAQTKKEFDYIFLDAPAGVDAGFRLTARFADRFLVVTGAGPAAVRDAARVSDLLDMMGKRDVRLIVNRVDRDMLSTVKVTVDDVMDSAGLPLMGVVLEDPNVTLAAAFGKPLLQYARRSPAAKAFRKIANRIQGFREPITLR
jgi:septum site-determining protein MinD